MTEEKLTMTASVMKFGKTLPAPNKYNKITQTWKKNVAPRILGTYNNRAEKVCFTEEAQAHSIAIPVNKADPINLELIRNRSQKCFISKTKLLGERMIKIQKNPLTSEHGKDGKLYNSQSAFFKTQVCPKRIALAKSAKISFMDKHIKAKSVIPGVGSYFKDPPKKKS